MTRITITGPVLVTRSKDKTPVSNSAILRKVARLVSTDSCVNYLAPTLTELDLQGGEIRFVLDADTSTVRVVTLYESDRNLTKQHLTLLKKETVGQWTDGIGEGCFDAFQEEHGLHFDFYSNPKLISVEQVEPTVKSFTTKRRRIFAAIEKGDATGVAKALDAGELIEDRQRGLTPLLLAAHGGSIEVMRLLLNRGADVNAADSRGWDALHFVAAVDKQFVPDVIASAYAELLLEAGGKVQNVSHDGYTPLGLARYNRKNKLVKILEKRGAKLFDIEIQLRSSTKKVSGLIASIRHAHSSSGKPMRSDKTGTLRLAQVAPGKLIVLLDLGHFLTRGDDD